VIPHNHDLRPLYLPSNKLGTTEGLKPYHIYLNRILRRTLTLKDGDASNINHFSRSMLLRFNPPCRPFHVFLFVWQEIRMASLQYKRGLPYAPHIMRMIEHVTHLQFVCRSHIPLFPCACPSAGLCLRTSPPHPLSRLLLLSVLPLWLVVSRLPYSAFCGLFLAFAPRRLKRTADCGIRRRKRLVTSSTSRRIMRTTTLISLLPLRVSRPSPMSQRRKS
jgi:hypothetical protein